MSRDVKEEPAQRRAPIFRTAPLEKNRVEAFSDGVIAIALTLLVLEIKVAPGLATEKELWIALFRLLPTLFAWVVSFAFVLTFWVNHHFFFSGLKHVDRGLLWLNGLFLLTIGLVPFPTALVGEYPGMTPPLALLSAAMMMTALSFAAMRYYASFHAGLLAQHMTPSHANKAMVQSVIAPLLYAIAVAMSFVWPLGSILIQIGVLILFFLRSPNQRPNEHSQA